jgi:hypothetical protein
MDDAHLFRRRLAARIIGLVGVSALALPEGCGGGHDGDGGAAGSTSVSSTGTSSTAADAGDTGDAGAGISGESLATPACFDLPDAGVCPTSLGDALNDFLALNCPSGWEPNHIVSGPTTDGTSCCYQVYLVLCTSGGRPYLVAGEALAAPSLEGRASGDWTLGDAPRTAGLTSAQRDELAQAWTADALAEHASVASFGRFSLSLLAAGAPADLVALAHSAALDEVRHARLCFALASAYAGRPIAPGPFPLGDVVPVEASLTALALSTVDEGCVGETIAAVVAAERAARATDPAVRAALEQIAADEARHAALAWRTVAWAIGASGGDVRAAVARAVQAHLAAAEEPQATGAKGAGATIVGHGVLDPITTATIVRDAMNEVVAPAALALLGGPSIRGTCTLEVTALGLHATRTPRPR